MNKLEQFTKRLQDAGLSERQIDEVVFALNEYQNAKFEEQNSSQACRYKIVGEPGDYQTVEQFGDYRISKKRFKAIEQAQAHIDRMEGSE